jgi:hypothetical protein
LRAQLGEDRLPSVRPAGRYAVARLIQKHGDANLPELLQTLESADAKGRPGLPPQTLPTIRPSRSIPTAFRRRPNLPLFSRISLMRNMKALRLMDVEGNVIFISARAAAAQGRKKRRRKKALPAAAPPSSLRLRYNGSRKRSRRSA